MVEIVPLMFASGSTTLEIQKEQDRDHDQGENQKLSLYQALSLKTLLADYRLPKYSVTSVSIRSFIAGIQSRPKLLPGLHVQSSYDYSQKWLFLSVWSHAQLTLATHCVINSSVVTTQPLSAMCDWQVWAYLQICSLHELFFFSLSYSPMVSSVTDMPLTPYPLESSLLSTLAPSSSSSDENTQSFTLRAPSKLKTTTQVMALNRCC